jgi:hypothetical protein
VHLVVIAWLYVIGMMAVTASSVLGGLVLFVSAGIVPVLALVAWLGRRHRRERAAATKASLLQQVVHHRDDADPESDK